MVEGAGEGVRGLRGGEVSSDRACMAAAWRSVLQAERSHGLIAPVERTGMTLELQVRLVWRQQGL